MVLRLYYQTVEDVNSQTWPTGTLDMSAFGDVTYPLLSSLYVEGLDWVKSFGACPLPTASCHSQGEL